MATRKTKGPRAPKTDPAADASAPPFVRVDTRRALGVLDSAVDETGDSWVLSDEYKASTGAMLVDVLTERDGAPIFELCMPASARAVVAAFAPATGWRAAIGEVLHLRHELARVKAEAAKAAGSVSRSSKVVAELDGLSDSEVATLVKLARKVRRG